MANVKKIELAELPVLFGEKTRKSEVVEDKTTLNLEGQVLETYSPKPGAIYRFPTWAEAIVKRQPVVEGSKRYHYLIACMMSTDGGKTFVPAWFSLNHLAKRNYKNEPVHPSWYALGNIGARGERLCQLGEIRVSTEVKKCLSPVFENEKPVMVVAMDENNNPVLEADGSPKMVNKTREQDVYDITPAA